MVGDDLVTHIDHEMVQQLFAGAEQGSAE